MYQGQFIWLEHFPGVSVILPNINRLPNPDYCCVDKDNNFINFIQNPPNLLTINIVPLSTRLLLFINDDYISLEIYNKLCKLIKRRYFTQKFIEQLRNKLRNEVFLLDDQLNLINFEDVIIKHL